MIGPLTSQIVGSYAKPQWLARHQRMRAMDDSWWRPDPEVRQEAREDAALLALYQQERAGLRMVTDGEAQRAAYDRHFVRMLSGVDTDDLERVSRTHSAVTTVVRDAKAYEEFDEVGELPPVVTADVAWTKPAAVGELRFLKGHACRPVKSTVIGPVSLACQLANRHYADEGDLILALAKAINKELHALAAAGADVLQLDEPVFHTRLPLARQFGPAAIAQAVSGVPVPVQVHICYGYAFLNRCKWPSPIYAEALELLAACPIQGISLEYAQPRHEPAILRHCGDKHVIIGLLNLGIHEVETPEHIAGRLRGALDVVPPERLHPASDCGMWFLPRDVAFGKVCALAAGTETIRREVGLTEPKL